MKRTDLIAVVGSCILTGNLHAQNSLKENEEELKPTQISLTVASSIVGPIYAFDKNGKKVQVKLSKSAIPPILLREVFRQPLEDENGNEIEAPYIDLGKGSAGIPYKLSSLTQTSVVLESSLVSDDYKVLSTFKKYFTYQVKFPNQYQSVFFYQLGRKPNRDNAPKVKTLSNEFDVFPKASIRLTNLSSRTVAYSIAGKVGILSVGKSKVIKPILSKKKGVLYSYALLDDNRKPIEILAKGKHLFTNDRRLNTLFHDYNGNRPRKESVVSQTFIQRELPKPKKVVPPVSIDS